MEEIAHASGVAKGAVYHHFESKEALFTRVLEDVQAELAARPVPASARRLPPVDQAVEAVRRYLIGACGDDVRQILLVDGPAVIGWQKWREIDFRCFGAATREGVRALLAGRASARRIDAATHLLMGAATEAALVCSASDDPAREAREISHALRPMLEGLAGGAEGRRARPSDG
jgi:AcrR family transcriptional regulator